jgi:hypothetical protein
VSERRPIGEVARMTGGVHVAGRVLVTGAGEFRLADETGDVLVRGTAAAGDIVAVRGAVAPEADGRVVHADEVTVLTPYRGTAPFPSPTGEAWRMTPARRGGLASRSRALRAIREFFSARGFLEVETPLRVRAPGL